MTAGRRVWWLSLAGVLAAACTPDPPCGLRLCDVREVECQRMAAAAAACLRGVTSIDVPVTVVPQEEFVAGLTSTPLTPEEQQAFRRWNAGLAALGLAPADNSPADDNDANARQVAGFYSPTAKQIVLVDPGEPLDSPWWVTALVHENTHALQDVRFDLERMLIERATDLDRSLAFGAVFEGEATYVEDLASTGLYGVAADDIDWQRVIANWQAWARSEARRSPLPVSLSWAHFRYPFGTGFVKGAADTTGWLAVDALYARPPTGTREVMAGFAAAEPGNGAWAEDLDDVAVPAIDDARWAYVGTERLGAWLLEVFLNRLSTRIYGADDLTRSLRGDVLSIFHDQSTNGAIAVWRLRATLSEAWAVANDAARLLPAARAEFADDGDVIVVAATDPTTLAAFPANLPFEPVPPPAAATPPLAARAGTVCVRHAPAAGRTP